MSVSSNRSDYAESVGHVTLSAGARGTGRWIRGIAWRDDGGRREVNRPSVDLWWMDALECRLVTGGARVVKWRSDQDAGNWPDSRAMGRADTGLDIGPAVEGYRAEVLPHNMTYSTTLPNPPVRALSASLSICTALVIRDRSNFERSCFVESCQRRSFRFSDR